MAGLKVPWQRSPAKARQRAALAPSFLPLHDYGTDPKVTVSFAGQAPSVAHDLGLTYIVLTASHHRSRPASLLPPLHGFDLYSPIVNSIVLARTQSQSIPALPSTKLRLRLKT